MSDQAVTPAAGSGAPLQMNLESGTPAATSSEPPSFFDHIPPDLKEEKWAQDFAKSENPWHALAKGYAGAQTMLGKKPAGLEVPGENATPEQISAWHKAIGVPEKPDGYQYNLPDISQQPEKVQNYLKEMAQDQNLLSTMKEAALKAGLTPKQFNAMASEFDNARIKEITELVTASEAMQAKAAEDRKAKFASLYGDKADKVQAAAKARMANIFSKEMLESQDPELMLIEALRIIDEKVYKSDTIASANEGAPGDTPESIHEQIMKLRAEKDPRTGKIIYDDPTSRLHDDHVAKIQKLYALKKQLEAGG